MKQENYHTIVPSSVPSDSEHQSFCALLIRSEIAFDINFFTYKTARITFAQVENVERKEVVVPKDTADWLDRHITTAISKVRKRISFCMPRKARMASNEILESPSQFPIDFTFSNEWDSDPQTLCDTIHDYVVKQCIADWSQYALPARFTEFQQFADIVLEEIHDLACSYTMDAPNFFDTPVGHGGPSSPTTVVTPPYDDTKLRADFAKLKKDTDETCSTIETYKGRVDAAITKTNTAISNAETATSSANTAATNANTATTKANTATASANDAANSANSAATLATNAAKSATNAATNANTAAEEAEEAGHDAEGAAGVASTAATKANTAAAAANTAATAANTAAENANSSATKCEEATEEIAPKIKDCETATAEASNVDAELDEDANTITITNRKGESTTTELPDECFSFNDNGTGIQTMDNEASGTCSFAVGERNTASGSDSHVEGRGNSATGRISHAEGNGTIASGNYSHAEGVGTKSINIGEHAQGEYNLSTTNKTIDSVGIGTSDSARKNAEETTLDGKKYILGVGGYDGTNVTDDDVKDVATVINEGGKVDDVQVDGVSVVTDKVANIDLSGKQDKLATYEETANKNNVYITTDAYGKSASMEFDANNSYATISVDTTNGNSTLDVSDDVSVTTDGKFTYNDNEVATKSDLSITNTDSGNMSVGSLILDVVNNIIVSEDEHANIHTSAPITLHKGDKVSITCNVESQTRCSIYKSASYEDGQTATFVKELVYGDSTYEYVAIEDCVIYTYYKIETDHYASDTYAKTYYTTLANLQKDVDTLEEEKADQSSLDETNSAVEEISLNLQGKFDTPDSKTIEGFGITDAYTKDEVDSAVNAKISEPATEGTSGQALVTDGEGGRSWQTISGGDTDEIELVSASALVELREYIDSLLNGITTKGKIIMSNDVVNNLTSLSSLKPLSAFQGHVISDRITENEQITASAFCDMATKLKPTAIAPEYNSYTIYTEGQYTIYNGLLYKCTTTLEKPEFFNADHWSLTSVMAEFSNN